MDLTPVESSLIAAIGYSDEKKELHVEFKKGGLYAYQGVPHAVFTAMMEAVSVGNFFLRNVKGQYSYVKVE